jgi:hypothetical protein
VKRIPATPRRRPSALTVVLETAPAPAIIPPFDVEGWAERWVAAILEAEGITPLQNEHEAA